MFIMDYILRSTEFLIIHIKGPISQEYSLFYSSDGVVNYYKTFYD